MNSSDEQLLNDIKNLKNKWVDKRIYTVNTINDIEEDARMAKIRITSFGGYRRNVFSYLDSAIDMAEKFKRDNLRHQENYTREAASYLQKGLLEFFRNLQE